MVAWHCHYSVVLPGPINVADGYLAHCLDEGERHGLILCTKDDGDPHVLDAIPSALNHLQGSDSRFRVWSLGLRVRVWSLGFRKPSALQHVQHISEICFCTWYILFNARHE